MLLGNCNPVKLSGLSQALYVLHSLEQRKTADEIANELGGDSQLVEIWTNFLFANQWIERTDVGAFSTTQRGKDWLVRFEERKP